ncbi:MAG: sigma-70 family RNA polymerase sigma factor [Prevotellaceae bacterium]|jgi:RNA polymerase sigma-70 factor (ECF subfamily)|nr:sigma-70 family RNA polymerase sigma factor [Prevotellaceae bacterium]
MVSYDDTKLIRLYRAGSSEAIGVLLERYRKKVYGYILSIVKKRDVADDVFQETCIKSMVKIKRHQYKDTGKFSAWIMRVAHNVVIDYYRNLRTNGMIMGSEYERSLLSRTAERGANVQQREAEDKQAGLLRRFICQLPEEQREVVVLRYYMSLSFKEIGEHLGIGINTALGRMRYALNNLQKMMAKEASESQKLEMLSYVA